VVQASEINLDFDEVGMENIPIEQLRSLIIEEIQKLEMFDFANDFAEELGEDY
jgi:hypothetical protein